MNYNEFMDALLSNDKSGSNFSCFTDKELEDFVNYFNEQLALGVKLNEDLLYAGGIAAAELNNRKCTVETK